MKQELIRSDSTDKCKQYVRNKLRSLHIVSYVQWSLSPSLSLIIIYYYLENFLIINTISIIWWWVSAGGHQTGRPHHGLRLHHNQQIITIILSPHLRLTPHILDQAVNSGEGDSLKCWSWSVYFKLSWTSNPLDLFFNLKINPTGTWVMICQF